MTTIRAHVVVVGTNFSDSPGSFCTRKVMGSKVKPPTQSYSVYCRFVGRNWQKITSKILFPMELDLQPYMYTDDGVGVVSLYNDPEDFMYDLASVIVHHGNGFGCGHYTSYCWNNEAGEREG